MDVKPSQAKFILDLIELGYYPSVYKMEYKYYMKARPKRLHPILVIDIQNKNRIHRFWFKNKAGHTIGLYHEEKGPLDDISGFLYHIKKLGVICCSG